MASRRDFLSATALTLGTVTATSIPIAAGAQAPSTAFDARDFMARLNQPYRHKQVFATARFAKGAVLAYMMNSLNAYQFGFNEGPRTLHAAAVLYGTGVVLGFDDYAWREYGLGTFAALDDEDEYLKSPNAANPHPDRNPFTHASSSLNLADRPDADPGFYHDRSMEDLRTRGASFFVCNNAATRVAATIRKSTAKTAPPSNATCWPISPPAPSSCPPASPPSTPRKKRNSACSKQPRFSAAQPEGGHRRRHSAPSAKCLFLWIRG